MAYPCARTRNALRFLPYSILVAWLSWRCWISWVLAQELNTPPLQAARLSRRSVWIRQVSIINGNIAILLRIRVNEYASATGFLSGFDFETAEIAAVAHEGNLSSESDAVRGEKGKVLWQSELQRYDLQPGTSCHRVNPELT